MQRPARRIAAAACLALATVAGDAFAATGGPDFYGYTWRDSNEPGVPYAWEDITTSGTNLMLRNDDRNSGFRPLSFDFPYYGLTYRRMAACTNGWVSLVDNTSTEYDNQMLPSAAQAQGTIAAFWDDLNLRNRGRMFFQDFGDRAVLTWDDVAWVDFPAAHGTFQVILFDTGVIRVQIQQIDAAASASATIGIENHDSTDGLTAYHMVAPPLIAYSVQFDPPPPIPATLDCANATPLACGADVVADLATGVPLQSQYRCIRGDFSGNEHVYVVDSATPTTVRWVLETISGAPQMIVIPACDPNVCSIPAGGVLARNNFTGSFYIVIDCAPGDEGEYRLTAECLPLATNFDCSNPPTISCGTSVASDLTGAPALQDAYWCTLADYSGSEEVWRLDFAVRVPEAYLSITSLAGDADLIAVYPCDANACLAPPGDFITITDAVGEYFVVVDCAPGNEGAYELFVFGGQPPVRVVGDALRVRDGAPGTATLDWRLAGAALPTEHFAVLRSERSPTGPWTVIAATRALEHVDATAATSPPYPHLTCYLVHVADECGNLSIE